MPHTSGSTTATPLDYDFLKKVFPAMLSASQFWMDRVKLASDGTYEAPNEWSPEHGPESQNVWHTHSNSSTTSSATPSKP